MLFDYLSLGKRVKQFRKRRGLSQMALAELANCATSYISYLENGQKCMSLTTFVTIANALQVSADELLVDCLDNNLKASNSELAALMSDCSEYERRVIIEIIKSAKTALRENKSYFARRRN